MTKAISPTPATSSPLPAARFDPDTKKIYIPTDIEGGFLEFDPESKFLNDIQMMFLGPLGIKKEWPAANVLSFLVDCRTRGFNPFIREAWLMQYRGRGGESFVHHIAISGMRRHADATGLYRGRAQHLFCGDDGMFRKVWPYKDVPPYACEATVRRADWAEPLPVIAYYDEYAPKTDEWVDDPAGEKGENGRAKRVKTGNQVVTPMWQAASRGGKPTVMLGKVAEAMALRGVFPTQFNGFYVPEELEAAVTDVEASRPADVDEQTERRREAYRIATQRKDVDGADIGAGVVDQAVTVLADAEQAGAGDTPEAADLRESIAEYRDQAGVQIAEPELMGEEQVRALLLDELAAQAAILGRTSEWMVVRWERAHPGVHFPTAGIGQIAAHVRRFRDVVVGELRKQGRDQIAARYNNGPLVADVATLFGVELAELAPPAAAA